MPKTSFVLHIDSLNVLDDMTDEQCGQLFKACKAYHCGQDVELSQLLKVAFSPFKSQFKRDLISYQKVCERNKLNGGKGGRPLKPKKPSGLSGNPDKPKKADSDSDSDSDSERKECTSLSAKSDPVPYQKIIQLYHSTLPELPAVAKLTPKRKGQIRQRFKEDMKELQHWQNFFEFVSQSDFLMGRVVPTNGRQPFRADIEWLTNPTNFTKIAEDKYHV